MFLGKKIIVTNKMAIAIIALLFGTFGLGMTPAYGNLVLYMPFDTISGTGTTPDLAGARDGKIMGNGVSIDSNIAGALPSGGNALRFAGSDDFVETIFPGVLGDNARSLSFWINRDANNQGAVVSYGRNTGDQKWVTRRNNAGGNGTNGAIRTEVNGGYEIGSTVITNANVWRHVVMTWESDGSPNINEAKFYINGVLETNTGVNGQNVNTSGANPLQIGNDRFSGARDWDGTIDDVAVFDRALTQAEVTALSNGSTSPLDFLTGPTPTEVFKTSFEYANGNPGLGGNNAAQLNGADDQVGLFEGAVPNGQGSGLGGSNLFSFKNTSGDNTGDTTLAVDRPNQDTFFDAVFTDAIRLDGADVAFELASIRTQNGNRNKDYDIIGLDDDGNESFHLVVNTRNNQERLTALINGGTALNDFVTSFGADANNDLNNAGTNGLDAAEIANIQLLLEDDGYRILFSRTGGSTYTTDLIDFNGAADSLSRIRFDVAGSTNNSFNSGFHLDNLNVRGQINTSVPEPATAVFGLIGLGGLMLRRRRLA
jgi:hypothetical protein